MEQYIPKYLKSNSFLDEYTTIYILYVIAYYIV